MLFTHFDPFGFTFSELTNAEGDAIIVVGVVVIGIPVAVDHAEIITIAGIRRTKPPVIGRPTKKLTDYTL